MQTNPTAAAVSRNRQRTSRAAGPAPSIAQPAIVIAPSTDDRSNPRATSSNQRLAGNTAVTIRMRYYCSRRPPGFSRGSAERGSPRSLLSPLGYRFWHDGPASG